MHIYTDLLIRSFKVSTLFFAVIFSLPNLWAQQPAFYPQTHEVGLQVISLHTIPELSDYYQSSIGSANYVNGLQYKYHWDLNNVIRLSAERRSAEFDIPEGINRFDTYSAEKKDWDIRLGYEANLPVGRWVLFAGLEGIYSQGEVIDQGILENGNDFEGSYTYQNLGVGGMGGIRWFWSPYISTTLEANLYYLDTRHDDMNENTFLLLDQNELGIAVRGYLSIHFVKLKKRCVCR